MIMSNTTAKEFAKLCGITESCARGRLNAFVAKGLAETRLEVESCLSNVQYDSNLHTKTRYYTLSDAAKAQIEAKLALAAQAQTQVQAAHSSIPAGAAA